MAKKKLGPVAWILGGCGAFILIGAIVLTVTFIWGVGKVKDFADDIKENPVAAAETLVRLNPDLEIVSKDESRKTITIRNVRGGEEFTVDASAVLEGRFEVTGSDGQRMTMGPDGLVIEDGEKSYSMSSEGDGDVEITADGAEMVLSGKEGTVTVEDKNGTTVFGESEGLPSWVPGPDGERMQGGMSRVGGGTVTGATPYRLNGSAADAAQAYRALLEEGGYEVEQTVVVEQLVNLVAKNSDRTIGVMIREENGETLMTLTYEGPE